ncbi:TIGR02444 family protein [Ferrimonas sediminum]|uniref:TIGR02444 family protein n=1 Tax=Ferrimonas sediminum TaxID=718193 RepID=A0A1G8V3G7_9GAMM|nr:TIGR02444 family protein [Ferrimonas sediminum]SDJ60407.1 TIGR02444 family protein [Ferrimonas sediminum]
MISHESLWQFGDKIWQQPQARQLCLLMQDEYQIDPNLLLLAILMEHEQMFLDGAKFTTLRKAKDEWEERMVGPYRQLRKLAKSSLPDDSYRQMLEVELVMEKRSQRLMVKALQHLSIDDQGDNLSACLQAHGLNDGDLPSDLLGQLSELFDLASQLFHQPQLAAVR